MESWAPATTPSPLFPKPSIPFRAAGLTLHLAEPCFAFCKGISLNLTAQGQLCQPCNPFSIIRESILQPRHYPTLYLLR